MTSLATAYEIRRTGPTIGSEIIGLRLADGVDDETRAALNREFLERKVLVFRDQHLTPDQHVAAAGLFGTPFDHPTAVRDGDGNRLVYPYDSQRDGKATSWHIGGLWRTPSFSIESLTYQVIPPLAGGTQWADLQAAYDDLSPKFKDLLEGLAATYDADPDHYAQGADRGRVAGTVAHPLVLTHPETGRKGLFLSSSALGVDGLSPAEGQTLLRHLVAHASAPRYTVRYSWNAGDFALWDNRATWHQAIDDYGDAPRSYRKVIVDRLPVSA